MSLRSRSSSTRSAASCTRTVSRPSPFAEQEAALAQSSLLNDAYRTLKDPVARTQYLLTLEGIQLEEQSKAATDAARASGQQKKQVVPPELLEEVFELNMQLAEMRAARQMGESPDDEPELRRDLLAAKDSFDDRRWSRPRPSSRRSGRSGMWRSTPPTKPHRLRSAMPWLCC